MSEQTIAPALVERMVSLVRELRLAPVYFEKDYATITLSQHEEVVSIEAELPQPIDPDVIEARRLVCGDTGVTSAFQTNVTKGLYDTSDTIRYRLAALKRGRELEREDRRI